MTLSIYRASIPVFLRGLDVLSVLLDKAAAHAEARSFDVGILLGARLAPDMLPFTGQIQRASDTAKFAAGRLTDLPPPRFADTEVTLNELRQRIDATADYLKIPSGAVRRYWRAKDFIQCRRWHATIERRGLSPEFRATELLFPRGNRARHPPSQRTSHRQTRISRLRPGVNGHALHAGRSRRSHRMRLPSVSFAVWGPASNAHREMRVHLA
jgi:Domain of unknown function (DUF1993)